MKNGKTKLNKTKIVALILLICTVTLMFSSCGSEKIEKPEDTNLEYWLLDKPDKKGWTQLSDKNTYLSKGYETAFDIYGNTTAPECAVVYTVSNYPLYDFGVKRVTSINISDPEIYVWGLTINSTEDEVILALGEEGFMIDTNNHELLIADNGHYRIIVRYNKSIKIMYRETSIIETIFTLGGNLK